MDNKIFLNIVTFSLQFKIAFQINCFNIHTHHVYIHVCCTRIMRIQFRDHFLLKGKLVSFCLNLLMFALCLFVLHDNMLCQLLQCHVIICDITFALFSYIHCNWAIFYLHNIIGLLLLRSGWTQPELGVTYTDIESTISVHDCVYMYFTY